MVKQVRAAGGVLWRPVPGGIEVALVHRPRYDDWSLPKGKLERGEHALAGALREVREETGVEAVAGRTLGCSSYRVLQDGRELPKTVRWWAMRARSGSFVAGEEVDELRWLAPDRAEALLTAGRDLAPLRLLLTGGLDTSTVLLVRHGRAGSRAAWSGDDALRPLDARGRRQAAALAALLPAYGPVRVVSAPAVRCQETVAPLARSCGLALEVDEVFGEQAYARAPQRALDRLRALAALPGTTVVASQTAAPSGLVEALAREAGLPVEDLRTRKGAAWALSLRDGQLVDADRLGPLA